MAASTSSRPRTSFESILQNLLACVIALAPAATVLYVAWHTYDSERHADGTPIRPGDNDGHAKIDFGGQWLMGRMVVLGLGPHLYDRTYLRPVLTDAYPRADEIPEAEQKPELKGVSEVEMFMVWLVGSDYPDAAPARASLLLPIGANEPLSAIALSAAASSNEASALKLIRQPRTGGALYPPIHAVLMAPLAYFSPVVAYRLMMVWSWLLGFVCGRQLQLLCGGRVWWPITLTFIFIFPGFSNALHLAQNSIVVLTLLCIGWRCIANDRPALAGLVWGFLAFKPTWAVAFFLIALLTRRWRVCVGMAATGALLALATLPFTGWHVWLDWLRVGKLATAIYDYDRNWIACSRDLLSIPRRWLVDFNAPLSESIDITASALGCGLVALVLEPTIILSILRRKEAQAIDGPIAAFLLLSGWFLCFHFMFYDELLTALPVFLLLINTAPYMEQKFLVFARGNEGKSPTPNTSIGPANVTVLNNLILTLIVFMILTDDVIPALAVTVSVSAKELKSVPIPQPMMFTTAIAGTPWFTFCALALWARCGWLWVKMKPAA
jgi:hypothetical protein